MSDLSKTVPDHDERQVKAAVAQGIQTPSQPSDPRPHGGSAPPPHIAREAGQLCKAFSKGGQRETLCFPSTGNLVLFQEALNVTVVGPSFFFFLLLQHPETSSDAFTPSYASTKFTQSPGCRPGQDRLGTLVSLSICNRVANVMSHLCHTLPECQDCPFG